MRAYLRIHNRSPYYQCLLKWQENGRQLTKEVSTGIPIKGNNKRKAEKKAEELRVAYEQKYEISKISDVDMLFSDYMLEWLENHKYSIRQSTYEGYKLTIENRIVPYFKKLSVSLYDLQPHDIQKYYTYLLNSGLSANSVKHHHANIRKALQDALIQNMIMYNPAERVTLPKVKKYRAKVFSIEQINAILQKVKDTAIESAVILGVYYGLRRSEICGLE